GGERRVGVERVVVAGRLDELADRPRGDRSGQLGRVPHRQLVDRASGHAPSLGRAARRWAASSWSVTASSVLVTSAFSSSRRSSTRSIRSSRLTTWAATPTTCPREGRPSVLSAASLYWSIAFFTGPCTARNWSM